MEAVNAFLKALPLATRNAIWYSFIVLFFSTMAIATIVYERRRASLKTATISALLTVLSFCSVLVVAYGIDLLTNHFIFLSGVTYCIPVILFSSYVLSKIMMRNLLETVDQVTLAYLVGRVVHITGCSLVGCCQGLPVSWGIYSAVSKTTVVPVQAIESVLILLAWIALNWYYCKNNNLTRGKVAALGLFTFGLINMVTDIFTVTFHKVFFMTSLEGIFGFVNMCTGLFLLYIIDKRQISQTNSNISA